MKNAFKNKKRKKTFLKKILFFLIFFHLNSQNSYPEEDIEKSFNTSESSEEEEEEEEAFYKKAEKKRIEKRRKNQKYEKISDLLYLAPFNEVVVIQRRYLPKTNRFEFSGNATMNLQNSLFNNGGGILRVGFYFTEQLSLEASYSFLKNSEKLITKKLSENFSSELTRYVRPSQYVGGSIKWSPIYGKLALFNQNIVTFDLFFTLNSGLAYIEGSNGNFSFGLGVGQIFPFSKSAAFRWDFNWDVFNPKKIQKIQGGGTILEPLGYQNNLFLSLGLSFFFPKAKYR